MSEYNTLVIKTDLLPNGSFYASHPAINDDFGRVGYSFEEVKKSYLELYEKSEAKESHNSLNLKIIFSLNIKKLVREFPVFSIEDLARFTDINTSLMYDFVKGSKDPNEEETKKILTGLEKLGKAFKNIGC